ncbi:hypothetical protein KKD70_01165 [Patescibacteria group bacterium]|nr:hypothetical protein [Patescibacteria group bacterium]
MKKLASIFIIAIIFTGCFSGEGLVDMRVKQESLNGECSTFVDDYTGLSFKHPTGSSVANPEGPIFEQNPVLYQLSTEFDFDIWIDDLLVHVQLQRYDIEEFSIKMYLTSLDPEQEIQDFQIEQEYADRRLLNKCEDDLLNKDQYLIKDCKKLSSNITTYIDASLVELGLFQFYYIETGDDRWPIATMYVGLFNEQEARDIFAKYQLRKDAEVEQYEDFARIRRESAKETLTSTELNKEKQQIIMLVDEIAKSLIIE